MFHHLIIKLVTNSSKLVKMFPSTEIKSINVPVKTHEQQNAYQLL